VLRLRRLDAAHFVLSRMTCSSLNEPLIALLEQSNCLLPRDLGGVREVLTE
jgi:hypothetical protein